jgi:SulP family sulfate permease
MPVIAAILFMVAYNMSEWRRFVDICKNAPKSDITVLILTFVLTVVFDLVVAIEIGLLVALVLFMKRMTDVTYVRTWKQNENDSEDDDGRMKTIPPHTQVYEINGPMFFATSDILSDIPIENGVKVIIIRMRNIPALDITAMRAIADMYKQCSEQGITVLFSHVNRQPMSVMKKSGFYEKAGKESFVDNIDVALKCAEEICS